MRVLTAVFAIACAVLPCASTPALAGSIPPTLAISADGSVSGTLGDAVLKNATVRKNRGALGRLFNMKSDFLIYADLDGSLVADKDVRYEGVFINLNSENGVIVAAGFTTTHSRFGTSVSKQGLARGIITLQKSVSSPETEE